MTLLDQQLEATHSYAGKVALLVLLGSHVEGLDMLIETLGRSLPANVVAEVESHKKSCARLLVSVQASIAEEASDVLPG